MKRICILFFQLFMLLQIVFCQNIIMFESNNIGLKIDTITNKYKIWKDSEYKSSPGWVHTATNISEGIINIDSNLITCIDTFSKKKIIFKQLDEYRLVVINKNHCFEINDTLYAIVISDKNGKPFQWMKWKDGKRHGEWSVDCEKGVNYTLYENGKIIKTYFKTYKEIRKELLNGPVSL